MIISVHALARPMLQREPVCNLLDCRRPPIAPMQSGNGGQVFSCSIQFMAGALRRVLRLQKNRDYRRNRKPSGAFWREAHFRR
jgi:hypothetical protein